MWVDDRTFHSIAFIRSFSHRQSLKISNKFLVTFDDRSVHDESRCIDRSFILVGTNRHLSHIRILSNARWLCFAERFANLRLDQSIGSLERDDRSVSRTIGRCHRGNQRFTPSRSRLASLLFLQLSKLLRHVSSCDPLQVSSEYHDLTFQNLSQMVIEHERATEGKFLFPCSDSLIGTIVVHPSE